MEMLASPSSITPHIHNILKQLEEEESYLNIHLSFSLEIALDLINLRQTVTIKFRVGIKSVSEKWK